MPLSNETLFSSEKMDWATPWKLFDGLNREFGFVLDAAASVENAKCTKFITEEQDAFKQNWHSIAEGGAVWLNPPYGRGIDRWLAKAYEESQSGCCVVVLTFSRTDTQWWHDYAMRCAEIRLLAGRVKFAGAANTAPAPSCLLVFDEARRRPHFSTQRFER